MTFVGKTWKDYPDVSTPITAAALQEINDELASYNTAWTSYTPTFTGSVSDPTLGTGSSLSVTYTQIGKTIIGRVVVVFGTGAAAGSGTYRVSLPVAARSFNSVTPLGQARLTDSSAASSVYANIVIVSSNIEFRYLSAYPAGTITTVTGSAPWTWADNDYLIGQFVYEAA